MAIYCGSLVVVGFHLCFITLFLSLLCLLASYYCPFYHHSNSHTSSYYFFIIFFFLSHSWWLFYYYLLLFFPSSSSLFNIPLLLLMVVYYNLISSTVLHVDHTFKLTSCMKHESHHVEAKTILWKLLIVKKRNSTGLNARRDIHLERW